MLTLAEVKNFLKVDEGEDEQMLTLLLTASAAFIKNATDKNADETTELFKLCQLFLIAHWYENPNMSEKAENLPFHLESLILQMKATTEDLTQ